MTLDADTALTSLRTIAAEFSAFLEGKPRASEADTRVKLIDRVMREVLGWPEEDISREDRVSIGYTDYQLRIRRTPLVIVEAKREGVSFSFPYDKEHRSPKLNGSLVTDKNIDAVIKQVRSYADDRGAKFAIATNGDAWIVFRAIRDDIPWREGRARVFPSVRYIVTHFTDFWNLLSHDAIRSGSLDAEFGRITAPSRKLLRVGDRLYNANLPIQRNRLNSQLQPLIAYIFEDIAAQDNLDLFQQCYLHTSSLHVVAEDLGVVIEDAIPVQLQREGTVPVDQTEHDAGVMEVELERSVKSKTGDLYLLLGGIGSGKSTFIRRYELIIGRELIDAKCLAFHLDFLKAPVDSGEVESFVWKSVLSTIRTEYAQHDLERRKYVKTIFKASLTVLEKTALRGIRANTEDYEVAIAPHLAKWQEDLSSYVPALLRFIGVLQRRAILLIIDNVDQFDPDYQAKIFLLAQRVTRLAGSVTIIALREESYYAPNIQRSFTAYNSHKFHIASPQFRAMIGNRVEYAIRAIERGDVVIKDVIFRGRTFDAQDISHFLRIVQNSVLAWRRRISLFMECICFGNMRSALQMFTTFLTSGATNVDKMLTIFRYTGSYTVAFHEFLKSVMLGDRAYYKETESPILNVFNCGADKNASHFTALRLLSYLLAHRSESTPEGQGYVDLDALLGAFGDAFDNTADVTTTLNRLVSRQLIEANTRSTLSIDGASHIRVTSAGWYYVRQLASTFAYLDLVLQDTPLNSERLEEDLRVSVYRVNNLSDRDEEKVARMTARFDRTALFLDYLAQEEAAEADKFEIERLPAPLCLQFASELRRKFDGQRRYIMDRLLEGRDADQAGSDVVEGVAQPEILTPFDGQMLVEPEAGEGEPLESR